MVRRIFAGFVVLLSLLLLITSVAGVGALWYYKESFTRETMGRLRQVDRELALADATLQSSEKELQRALQIVDASQDALEKLSEQSETAESLFDRIQGTLDNRLLPELKTTRNRIVSARATLVNLQSILTGVSSFLPGVDLNIPSRVVTDLIASTEALDSEIASMEVLATQASTFVADTSTLLGGDLTETRKGLQDFISAIQDYQVKVARWREQSADVLTNMPGWIDRASIIVTVFLLWFGISQFSLLMHGLALWRGMDPFRPVRRERYHNPLIKDENDLEKEE